MKSTLFLRNVLTGTTVVVAAVMLSLSSCKKETLNKPAPSISVSAAETSNLAGNIVSTTVSVNAPEGGKTLAILVNGNTDASVPDVTLTGTVDQDVVVSYTIPSAAPIGGTYLITFQASDKKGQLSALATFLVTVSAVPNKEIVDVPAGNITVDTHWTADKIYRLNGFVRIGTDTHTGPGVAPVISATATLTIDAGTVIYGKTGAPGGTLIIQRGSKLIAIGTAAKPIVFTSEKAPGSRTSGDWGGVVLCGKATNNTKGSASTGTDGIEELEGAYGAFHGNGANSDDADNSGTLQYVRIEFAGYPIQPNQEINGLTFGSIGTGTTIDHVQAAFSNDDSFEWFGGKVNCKNLIAFKGLDDDFDTDNGFSGQVQFSLGIRDPNIADQSGSNGFECDNDALGSSNLPITNATFSNMTIIGGKATYATPLNVQFQNGAQIRRNAKQDLINSFVTAYPNGIYIDNAAGSPGTIANAAAGELVFRKNVLAGVEKWGGNGFGSATTVDERSNNITGLPFSVPQAAGSSTLGDYNHVAPPRGLIVAGGVGSFSNGAFSLGTVATINAVNPLPWFITTNTVMAKWNDSAIKLDASIFSPTTTPVLLPGAGSILLTGADFTGYTGFTSVNYIGAFGDTDWTTGGWVNWNPQITDYTK
ncbi:MAG TPA: hypothetical protein VK517_13525 [Cyclobacteriaceae bacterium]|nr:hypothetical protein [Cyclobacteriaceae bacterium]